jgi:putative FmdB family regulatory protein
MPTYEYKCTACGHAFERFQSIKAAPIKKCPECGKNKVKRLIGIGAGLLFKGSGFYITDYRPESYNTAAKADAPPSSDAKPAEGSAASEAKPASKSESKSESKAEAKVESKPVPKVVEKKDSKRK